MFCGCYSGEGLGEGGGQSAAVIPGTAVRKRGERDDDYNSALLAVEFSMTALCSGL